MDINTFFSGGLLLMLVGGAIAYARNTPHALYSLIKRRFLYSIEIQQTDDAFDWIIRWLNAHPSMRRSKTLALQTKYNESGDQTLVYSPLGNHFLFYGGKFVWIHRARERMKNDGLISLYETMSLSTIGGGRGILERMVTEAKDLADEAKKDKVIIKALASWGEWNEIARKNPRHISSVILKADIKHRTLDDIRLFNKNEDWYKSVGIPYRRGYLLFGPPGNGKTSLIFAIASELRMNLAVLNMAGSDITDNKLLGALSDLPKNSILLVEDIDAIFVERENKAKDSRLTFSGLLNAMDGVATSDGRILFFTTNHKELLDPALIRPGRIDVAVAIDPPEHDQIKEMFLRFFPGKEADAEIFASNAPALSAAAFQEYFVQFKDSEDALRNNKVLERV
jgi:chaperone BCS1